MVLQCPITLREILAGLQWLVVSTVEFFSISNNPVAMVHHTLVHMLKFLKNLLLIVLELVQSVLHLQEEI